METLTEIDFRAFLKTLVSGFLMGGRNESLDYKFSMVKKDYVLQCCLFVKATLKNKRNRKRNVTLEKSENTETVLAILPI